MKKSRRLRQISLALLASSNLDLLQQPLIARLMERGFSPEIWNPGFNQYRQVILDPSSELYDKSPQGVILYLDASDLFADHLLNPYRHHIDDVPTIVDRAFTELSSLIRTIQSRLPSATVYLNSIAPDLSGTYYGMEYNSDFTFQRIVAGYNARLREVTGHFSSALVIDVEFLAASCGLARWYDPRMWYLGRIRYSSEAHSLLAAEYANFIAARSGDVRKCIVIDLDNTVWGGIIGEDGIAGIDLGHQGIGLAFVEFQRDLLNLQQKGVLLAICSKNNPEDALEAIRNHSAMVLREEHFAAVEVNWNEKAENIRELARRLNIGIDSLVFIDDSQVERRRVRELVPEVAVPEWPQDPSEYRRALRDVINRYFLKFNVTAEDQSRGEMYREQAERERLAETAENIEDFFRSLQMRLRIASVDTRTSFRVSQLTQRTNQFTLTTRRYTEAEILAMSNEPDCLIYWLDLEDRFGQNGIVGVLILRKKSATAWHIDTLLLSCRVIGRTVENALLGYAVRDLREQGVSRITGEYIRSEKNEVASQFYNKLGFVPIDTNPGREIWELDIKQSSVEVPDWFEIITLEGVRGQ